MQSIITHAAVALAAGAYGVITGAAFALAARGEVDPRNTRQQRLHSAWVKDRALVWPWAAYAVRTGRAPFSQTGE